MADAASTRVPQSDTQLTEKHTVGYAVSWVMSVHRTECDAPGDAVFTRHSGYHSEAAGYGARGRGKQDERRLQYQSPNTCNPAIVASFRNMPMSSCSLQTSAQLLLHNEVLTSGNCEGAIF